MKLKTLGRDVAIYAVLIPFMACVLVLAACVATAACVADEIGGLK